MQDASNKYKQLTDEQAMEILVRVSNSSVDSTIGASFTENFFLPHSYEGRIVDAEDVFAVGYTTAHKVNAGVNDVILCAVFTNDLYVPVFPMIYVAKTSLFEFSKSKKGRENINVWFESVCPNLKYPVGDIKQLKKQIKQDGELKGDVDIKFMLDQILNATVSKGIFDYNYMASELSLATKTMLDRIGYIPTEDANSIMRMDKMFIRNYWTKQLNNLYKLDY